MSFNFDQLLGWIWHILPSCSLLVTRVSYITDLLYKFKIYGVGNVSITSLACLHLQHLLFGEDFVGAMLVFFDSLWQVVQLFILSFLKFFEFLTILLNLLLIFLLLLNQRQILFFKLDKVRFELLWCLERQRIGLIWIVFEEERLQRFLIRNFILRVSIAVGFTLISIVSPSLSWNRSRVVSACATPSRATSIKWLCLAAALCF